MAGPILSFLVLLTAPAGLVQEPTASAASPRPSVVLVTVDTLRREHLGCYGYPRPTSPRVDALAAGAVLFERAFATMATTFPSHLSMLTGLHPHQHGHTSNRAAMKRPYEPGPRRRSVAGELAAAGYRTAGFVSSVVLHRRTGIGAGFTTFDTPAIRVGTRPASVTMQAALAWLAAAPSAEPVFLWVHLWDVHEPNEPEPGNAALLAVDETLRGWVAARGLPLAALQEKYGAHAEVGERFFARAPAHESGAPLVLDEAALLGLYARYDACVRQVDTEVGRLIDALVAGGRWAHTAFVFTADHGQSLGENTFFGHGVNTEINAVVPLVVRFPESAGVPPQRSRALVSLVDLLPMLLARLPIAGLERLRVQLVGQDPLAPDFTRERVFTSETTEFHGGEQQPYRCALHGGRWKYVRAAGEAGRLYDLEGAGEFVDVAAAHPELARELEALLAAELSSSRLDDARRARRRAEPADPEEAELLEQLDGLGYGGGDEDE